MKTVTDVNLTHFFLYIWRMNLKAKSSWEILQTISVGILSLLCLILLIPLIILLSVSIKLTGRGPVIYSQKRIGRNGKPFIIYKFRSLHIGTEDGFPLISGKEDKRITILGRFMRKHKFDEIPNLFNVLKGEMSIIGPRPEQQIFIDQIIQREPRYKQLQLIKPGITSWGQVKYGYASNVEEMIKRMEYDLFYLENRSLIFDLKITLSTIAIILKGKGI
jgi:lipopolysaccharide/colanic/teichoic acid biosynthesis glycosyltransferase